MTRLDFSALYNDDGKFVAYNIRYEEDGKVREFILEGQDLLYEAEDLIKAVLTKNLKTSL